MLYYKKFIIYFLAMITLTFDLLIGQTKDYTTVKESSYLLSDVKPPNKFKTERYLPFVILFESTCGMAGELSMGIVAKESFKNLRNPTDQIVTLLLLNAGSYCGVYLSDRILHLESNKLAAFIIGIPGNLLFIANSISYFDRDGSNLSEKMLLPFIWIPFFQSIGNRTSLFKRKSNHTALFEVKKGKMNINTLQSYFIFSSVREEKLYYLPGNRMFITYFVPVFQITF